jgi:hypothetical protein
MGLSGSPGRTASARRVSMSTRITLGCFTLCDPHLSHAAAATHAAATSRPFPNDESIREP